METTEQMSARWAREIAEAGAATEKEMREADVPRITSAEQLADYVGALVDRPHDYGTCVYAMSMAAVAAFNYVAHELGVTGFQASCADLDILRRTRDLEWGRVQDFTNLLYPQYEDRFTGLDALLCEHREELAKRAAKLLADSPGAAPGVVAHWHALVAAGTLIDKED